MDNEFKEMIIEMLVENPANPIIYGHMEIRDIVRLKAENELDFNVGDYEFMAALLGQDGKHLL
ncbi:MAG: hypothetical protein DRN03_04985 [Thermoplasmata archaeon]|nr:MAG: hypothetical protein DRN03_04985 [Thermoplasmata archaeon]